MIQELKPNIRYIYITAFHVNTYINMNTLFFTQDDNNVILLQNNFFPQKYDQLNL